MQKVISKKARKYRLFTKIMMIVTVTILVVSLVLSAAYVSVARKRQIDQRLDELTEEAREIAYLSAQSGTDMFSLFTWRESTAQKYIQWKAGKVYEKYGGIIFVADRSGRIQTNLASELNSDPDIAASISGTELRDALLQVVSGNEIKVKTMVSGAPTFTVGVPYIQDGMVLGAVLIQTRAQHIEGITWGTIVVPLLISMGICIIAACGIYLLLRHAMEPLTRLTKAAERISDGDFTKPDMGEGNMTPEIEALADAFGKMTEKLSQVEGSRKEFVANVSHELRSPITSISGYIQGMTDGTIPAEEYPRYMEIVKEETARLTKLIGDLLALSRLEKDDAALKIVRLDINEMLRRVAIRRMNDIEGKQIELCCQFEQDPMMTEADSDRIEQVAVNLIDNAIKFTPVGGKIWLKTSADKQKNICCVTVEDNGIGILPEDRNKVFDRFFTADRAHTAGKGTGLGLSICQRICQMHGQSIYLEDCKDTTAFTFTLKLWKEDDEKNAQSD